MDFLTLLAILIVLALIFQAPWKVTILLIVILAAYTILPKLYRKWFWLSVAVIVLMLIIWVFLPADNEGWRPYTFDEELAALNAKYSIPDSQNAATFYNQLLLEDYNEAEFYENLPRELQRKLHIRAPWTGPEHPVFMKWLNSHQDTITTLIDASKIEKCRLPIYVDNEKFRLTYKHLNAVRRWTRLLSAAAYNDLGEGRIDEAFEKQMTALALGKHQRQQPALVQMLIGMASEAMALRGFRVLAVTCDASEQQLDAIDQAVAAIEHDWDSDFSRMLENNKLWIKNQFGKYYEINLRGRLRLSRDPKAEIRARMKDMKDAFEKLTKDQKDRMKKYYPIIWSNPNYWQRKLIRAKTILYWFYLPLWPQKGGDAIDTFYEKFYKRDGVELDWKKEPNEVSPRFSLNYTYLIEDLVISSSVPVYDRIHDMYLRYTAVHRGCRLIIALRRYTNKYGQWPQNLYGIKNLVPPENFVDPINGGSFIYKLTEENFTLYSKGKNNIDEGGRRGGDSDDFPIWSERMYKPPIPFPPQQNRRRKNKNEKADDQQSNTQKDEIK
ncbi:MAG: hypothetical protein ACYS1A_18000 [Planctomycetota bacterium]